MARISPGTMTVLVFAILIGLGGAYAVRQYLHKPPQVAQDPPLAPADVVVPVAITDLEPGHKLTINDVALMRYAPSKFRETKHAGTPYMRQTNQIEGRMLREPVAKGDAFLPGNFYPDGMAPGIAEMLKPGFRAVTVPIENIGAVAGFARPGSVVDVLFRSIPLNEHPEVTLTLLEMVEVLAIDKEILPGRDITVGGARGNTGAGMVTLAVSPPQAKALKVVEGRGTLSMTLRHPDEPANIMPISASHRVMLEDVLGLGWSRPKTMEIFLGASKQTIEFRQPQRTFLDEVDPVPGFIKTPIASDGEPGQTPTQPVSSTTAAARDAGS